MTHITASNAPDRHADTPPPKATAAGLAPRGVWWVAWRQHRLVVLIGVGLLMLLTGAVLVFRWRYNADVPGAVNCTQRADGDGDVYSCQSTWEGIARYQQAWAYLRLPLLGLPILLGAIAGGALISQERDRGTHIFALTQSVSTARWYLTKCMVVAVPLVIAQAAAGLIAASVASAPGLEGASKLDTPYFQSSGLVPAAFLLLSFCVATSVGVFIRSTLAAVSAGLALAVVAVIALGYVSYPNLAPHSRVSEPITAGANSTAVPAGSFEISSEYAGPDGRSITMPGCPELANLGQNAADGQTLWTACLQRQGITQRIVIYIDPGRLTQIVATLWAIATALAATSIGIGLWRIRHKAL